jgi:predicted nucleotidyltransferase
MPGEDPQELTEILKRHLSTRSEILEAYLFGSVARGQAQSISDVDVAVRIDVDRIQNVPFGYAAALTADLAAALRLNRVDVVVLNHAPPLLYHRVLRDGQRLFARDLAATTTREGQALSRYCDYLPQLEKVDRILAARIEGQVFGR